MKHLIEVATLRLTHTTKTRQRRGASQEANTAGVLDSMADEASCDQDLLDVTLLNA
jgi:hypothetical protein